MMKVQLMFIKQWLIAYQNDQYAPEYNYTIILNQ